MISPEERLKAFQSENHITTKGPLSLVVQFTRMVRDKNFPLNPDDFQTSRKGQVAGLGGANLKKILKEHGITQQLSSEGGRTSRGSMGLMIKYVDFLNAWNAEESVDFSVVEEFWAEQVREYFRNPKRSAQIWTNCLSRRKSARSKIQARSISVLCCSTL